MLTDVVLSAADIATGSRLKQQNIWLPCPTRRIINSPLDLRVVSSPSVVAKSNDGASCLKVMSARKTGLTEGLSRAPYVRVWRRNLGPTLPPRKKNCIKNWRSCNFPRCMEGLTCTLPSLLMVDHLSRSHLLATPPSLFLCKFGQITRPIFAKSWGTYPLETQWLRQCWSRCKAISWLLYSWQLIIFCRAQEPAVSVAEVFVFCSCRL